MYGVLWYEGCCERGSKRTKHRATVVSFYATRNLRTSVIMNRDNRTVSYCHVWATSCLHGTDMRHLRFQFCCICILERIVDSESWLNWEKLFFVFPSSDRTEVRVLVDSRVRGSQRKKHSHVNIAFYATCNWHACLMIICNEWWWTSKLSISFPFFSVKGCCERGSKRTKHRATVVSFYATRNLRT